MMAHQTGFTMRAQTDRLHKAINRAQVEDVPCPQNCRLELRLQVAEDFASIEHLETVLDETTQRLGGTIYMTLGWLKVWWQFYHRKSRLRLFLFWHGETLVAFIPCYLERFGAGLAGINVARLVGANIPPKAFEPTIDPEFTAQVLSILAEHLLETEKCDLLSFGPISKASPAAEAFCKQELLSDNYCVSYTLRDVRTIFRLPPTYEAYLDGFEPGERKSRMKRMRQLERNCVLTDDIVSEPELVQQEFERFAEMHSRQWEQIGKGGHFSAWPNGLDFNRALVMEQAKKHRVRFFRLLADGDVIANRYTFILGSTLFSELPARATGEVWDKRGIGVLSLIRFTGQAIRAGVSMIDSGLGAYEHKSGVGGEEVEVGLWRVFRSSLLSRARLRCWLWVSQLHMIFFQKIWYRRLLPKMPASLSRTQSLFWLRYDF